VRHQTFREVAVLSNVISAARLPLAAAFPLATSSDGALAVIGAAGITDLLDGFAARKLGQVSPVGAAIDGVADKVFGLSLLVTLVARGVLAPASALLLATREAFELPLALRVLVRPKARVVAKTRSANRLGKLATSLQLGAIVAAITRSRAAKPLAVAAGAVGALAGISYWVRELRDERALDASFERRVPYLLAGGDPARLAKLAA
jgi:CDP-diacylglycerol--glycerol-3-phosphate 3-phosphatidyltransferase/cardiolipin synthase